MDPLGKVSLVIEDGHKEDFRVQLAVVAHLAQL